MAQKLLEKKVVEADAWVAEADKLTTKTLFRWKCDWENAAPLYEKAGAAYKGAKVLDKSKNAFVKAANAWCQYDIPFSAAKCYENAAAVAKELNLDKEAAEFYLKASSYFSENGSNYDKAAETLVKAAKIFEETDPKKAVNIYHSAIDSYQSNGKEIHSNATFKAFQAYLVKTKQYEEAIQVYNLHAKVHDKLEQRADLPRDYLMVIILHLAMEDLVAADKAYHNFVSNEHTFGASMEGKAAAALLDLYEKGDNDEMVKLVSKQTFTLLDNGIAKLAKTLKVPDLVSGPKPTQAQKPEEADPMKAELFKVSKPKPKQSEAPVEVKKPEPVVETTPTPEPVKPTQAEPKETEKEEPWPVQPEEEDEGLA